MINNSRMVHNKISRYYIMHLKTDGTTNAVKNFTVQKGALLKKCL